KFSARRRGKVGAGVRVPADAPTPLGRLGEKYPRALGQRWVSGGGRDDVGQLPYNAELLVAIENADGSEDLHPDVVVVADDVGQRIGWQVVDEGGGVVLEEREIGHLLPPHHRGSE